VNDLFRVGLSVCRGKATLFRLASESSFEQIANADIVIALARSRNAIDVNFATWSALLVAAGILGGVLVALAFLPMLGICAP
jgi:hypothetical protein